MALRALGGARVASARLRNTSLVRAVPLVGHRLVVRAMASAEEAAAKAAAQ